MRNAANRQQYVGTLSPYLVVPFGMVTDLLRGWALLEEIHTEGGV